MGRGTGAWKKRKVLAMLQALYLLISGRFTTTFTVGCVFAGIFVVIFAGMNYFLNTLISAALKEV